MIRDVFYFNKKPNVHPREKHADNLAHARSLASTEHFWIINEFCDYRNFDWDWDFEFLHDEDVWAEEHNNVWPSFHQKDSGTWLCPSEFSDIIIYRADVDPIIRKNEQTSNWNIIQEIDKTKFDFSWHPDVGPAYIYVWGNKWNPVELEAAIEYHVSGATERKYMADVVDIVADMSKWEIDYPIDSSTFDFTWRPDPREPAMLYQFGTQWQKTCGPRYIMPGAEYTKYVEGIVAKILPNTDNWVIPRELVEGSFDYSWHPDTTNPLYIYQFSTQWVLTGGPRYIMPGATMIKQVDFPIAKAAPNRENWIIPDDIDIDSFDFSWHPYAEDMPFIYQFGTQWQKTGGPKYIAEGAEDGFSPIKYIDTRIIKAKKLPSPLNWVIPADSDTTKFDFSWHPDSTAPPQIYQWINNGPRFVAQYADESAVILMEKMLEATVDINQADVKQYFIESTLEDLIIKHPDEVFWALNSDLLYDEFDFDQRPAEDKERYINVFGNEDNKDTQTYFVNAPAYTLGYKEYYYVEGVKIKVKSNLNMFFVDRGNSEVDNRFQKLKTRFPNIQKTRYLNSWVDTINRCVNRANTNLCWILNSELDYSNFDFDYYPSPWQMNMVHVFGTQWSHWGTTFVVNRNSFAEDTKYVKIIEHLSNLNFVKRKVAAATNCLYDAVVVDHGNTSTNDIVTALKAKLETKSVSTIKYADSYLNTFRELLKTIPEKKEHYLWVCSSICDYSQFDFSYICDPFAKEQLHVFPSDKQKFGDTFLVDVNKLRSLVTDMVILEDYTKINYNQHQRVKRLQAPQIITLDDTHVNSAKADFKFPYAVLTTHDNVGLSIVDAEPMSLWSPEHKNIIITSVGGTRIIVPAEAKNYITKELYDYPYITSTPRLAKSAPLDIVFLSNGEAGADANYEHLLKLTKGLSNKVVRVDGVDGRVAAYHAAATASTTPWMFTVFAKLKVNHKFDWNWQPDRLQIAKHYIFNATNPVNGLVYGHQAMIAYNKNIVLNNLGKGLDFTLDDEHEVVELNSGTAHFNTDAWSTWRTAFREAIKLRASSDSIESAERLQIWLTNGTGDFAEYSTDGAKHAVAYYDEVAGDMDKLKLSYDWPWLRARFESIYPK